MTKPEYPTVRFGDVAREVTDSTHTPLEDGFECYIGLEHLEPESLNFSRIDLYIKPHSGTWMCPT